MFFSIFACNTILMQHQTKQYIISFFKGKSLLSILILVNTGVWLLLLLLKGVEYLLPAGKEISFTIIGLAGIPSVFSDFLKQPWSIFTYSFVHTGFFHLVFNMMMLYFSGILFYQYLGKKLLAKTYFAGAVFGAVCFIACSYFVPVLNGRYLGMIIGASPAVLAVLFRLTREFPEMKFSIFSRGRIKLKYLALIFLAVDLMTINGDDSGGLVAHIAGAGYGFGATYVAHFFRRFSGKYRLFTQKRKGVSSKKNERKKEKILKKISVGGYANLTDEEKEFLFKKK